MTFESGEEETCRKYMEMRGIYLYKQVYVYRRWHYYTGESSKEIYKQAPAKTMRITYFPYHTMSVDMAIDRLKESYEEKRKK